MNTKISVFIATSLDGFISRSDGSIDWLTEAQATVPVGEDCGYRAFFNSVDVLIMGRNTFEQVLQFKRWPYTGRKVVVMSRRRVAIPEALASEVVWSSETPDGIVTWLWAQGAQHLYVDGGRTIQGFLAAGLIDEITITVIPRLLGTGRPLFGELARDVKLELMQSRAYPFGFVQSKYRVQRD
jgi:dihydrofolate reductase